SSVPITGTPESIARAYPVSRMEESVAPLSQQPEELAVWQQWPVVALLAVALAIAVVIAVLAVAL
ncbi:MAG TPA: hypothetical protein VFQ54_10930, partial [Thermomicrobiales bacterium]|nr:hypothetical protein [Thermomicrobiales bacterium]